MSNVRSLMALTYYSLRRYPTAVGETPKVSKPHRRALLSAAFSIRFIVCCGPAAAAELEDLSCRGDASAAATSVLAEYRQRMGDATILPSSTEGMKALLSAMRRGDQEVQMLAMHLLGRCGVKPDSEQLRTVMLTGRTIVETNKDVLGRIIKEKGWPVISIYGADADQTAFLIAQHADPDPAFQQKVLKILEKQRRINETSAENYALLFDRVRVAAGKSQRYGSQGSCEGDAWVPKKIEDPRHVDRLRSSVGLEPMVTYREKVTALLCAGGR